MLSLFKVFGVAKTALSLPSSLEFQRREILLVLSSKPKRTMPKIILVKTSDLKESDIASLSSARLEKASRYLQAKDRLLSLAAGIALDKGLQEYGLREKDATILTNEHGKPYLKDYPNIHFNLSHSGEIALAVFDGREVGCDIERKRPLKEEVMKRCFSKEEREYIEKAKDKDEAFTRIWVYKESFIKALGMGLAMSLSSFSVAPTSKGIVLKQTAEARN